jgi:hypothetical protein
MYCYDKVSELDRQVFETYLSQSAKALTLWINGDAYVYLTITYSVGMD